MTTARTWIMVSAAALTTPAWGVPGVPGVQPAPGVLNLRAGDIDTSRRTNLLVGEAAIGGVTSRVLVLDGPMSPERRAALDRAGVRLKTYLPTNAYIADVSRAHAADLRALGFVTFVGEFDDAWKLDPSLARGARVWNSASRNAIEARGERVLSITLFGDEPVGPIVNWIVGAGGDVRQTERSGESWVVTGVVAATRVAELAGLAPVQFVEELPEFAARSNATTRWVVQSNAADATPLYDHGLTGVGQIVGVIDGWVAPQHCSFLDATNPVGPLHRKILAYNTFVSYDAHGTHVAATAVGDAGDGSDTRGVAYGAKMVFNTWPDDNEPSMYQRFLLHHTQGARIHTNSWGADYTSDYVASVRGVDAFCADHEDSLVVFATSNSSLVHMPENAKNCLAVSASGEAPLQETFCSGGAGPTPDGRRKPEITAPGCLILSAVGPSGCSTGTASGTSMATPAVSGVAALARQYFTSGYYPSGAPVVGDAFTPSAALLKATLVNSAVDMTGVAGYPSNTEGWGRVLVHNTLVFAGDAGKLKVVDALNNSARALATGQTRSIVVGVADGTRPFKVTSAFTDAPAAVNASYAPVNDLDLDVHAPDGTVYHGNVFVNGASAPGGTNDPRNNLEQVVVPTPAIGRWIVSVSARAVNVGTQGYALVVTGGLGTFCVADVDDGSGTGHPDGGVTIDDLLYYLPLFDAGDVRTDVDDGSGTGNPDGGVTIDDLLYFLLHLDQGC